LQRDGKTTVISSAAIFSFLYAACDHYTLMQRYAPSLQSILSLKIVLVTFTARC